MQNEKPDSRDPSGSASHELPPPGAATRSMETSEPLDPSPLASRPSPLIYLLRAVASLRLAVVLIALYTAVLVWATAIEKSHGAAAAHSVVYGAGWFVALNALFAVNILAAVLIRFPWRLRQTGFVVTHLGVVVLLIGCLLSWLGGVEAMLPVVEGHAEHIADQDSYHFELQIGSRKGDNTPDYRELSAIKSIDVPFVAGPFDWKKYAKLNWFPWRLIRRSQGTIYDEDGIELEVLDYVKEPQPYTRVRLTVDGAAEEFHLGSSSEELYRKDQRHVVTGKQRSVAITFPMDTVDLGFQVFLHKFRRKLDPGATMASHYSSLVDFLDREDPSKILQENVLITLNAPVDFADPRSGRTYRLFQSSFDGPWTPDGPTFHYFMGDDRDRDHVYRSVLSVNYDPGRWWKYVGSLLIVAGIVLVYYVRPGRGARARRLNGGVWIVIPFLLVGGARAAETERLDWSEWQHLPAFGEGRVEPLDSFARKSVEAICGRTDPTLVMEDGGRRKYAAAELLFAWLAETEKWEYVPFLPAEDEWLRRDVLTLPLRGGDGRRLSFVSPAQMENNSGLGRYLVELRQRAELKGKKFRLSKRDRKVERLLDAYGRYRRLTFDAEQPKDTPRRFFARVGSAGAAWRKLIADRQAVRRIAKDEQVRELTIETSRSYQELIARFHEEEFSRKKIEPAVAAFRLSGEKLAGRIADGADKPLAALAANLRRQTAEMHLALYDNGDTLRLVPALNAGALEENRKSKDDAPPWLNFQALIYGGGDLLRAYPQAELDELRKKFAEAKAVYRDRESPNRSVEFAAAMHRFAESVRTLSEKIEPIRRRLPLLHRDESLLRATAYPPPGSTAVEVFYNRLDPFFWSWGVGLAAMLCLLSVVGRLRQPAFWLGAAALTISLGFTLAGLGLRTYITGLVPLTGMFESVVVVATFVYALGLWLALLPLWWSSEGSGFRVQGSAKDGVQGSGENDEGWAIDCPLKRSSTRIELVLQRRLFALAGAIVGTLALILAYYAPATVMHRNIGAVTPILRDNFWLVVHVVTIMAGYASAAIALILGNVALGCYLFGRYVARPPSAVSEANTAEGGCATTGGRRPPPACSVLAGFISTAIKITVLLLAAGSILGALWADKSWGRFWGWDPKEVWALISLLVYLLFLHARHIGWSGNFGMSATAVLGATVILFNWYGVNFVLGSGLHAYGAGAGGLWQVGAAVLIQWLFLFAAVVRYLIETRGLFAGSAGV